MTDHHDSANKLARASLYGKAADDLTIPATPSLEQDQAYLAGYRAGYMAMVPTLPLDAPLRGFYRVGYSRGEVDRCSMHAPRYPLTAAEAVMLRDAGATWPNPTSSLYEYVSNPRVSGGAR